MSLAQEHINTFNWPTFCRIWHFTWNHRSSLWHALLSDPEVWKAATRSFKEKMSTLFFKESTYTETQNRFEHFTKLKFAQSLNVALLTFVFKVQPSMPFNLTTAVAGRTFTLRQFMTVSQTCVSLAAAQDYYYYLLLFTVPPQNSLLFHTVTYVFQWHVSTFTYFYVLRSSSIFLLRIITQNVACLPCYHHSWDILFHSSIYWSISNKTASSPSTLGFI